MQSHPLPAATRGTTAAPYRPELDALRFFAFFAVFLHHAFPQHADGYAFASLELRELAAAAVRAGGFGVDLFFVLSAYLITQLLVREVATVGKLDAFAFYVRRALRIWPLYVVFVLVAWLVTPRLFPDEGLGRRYVACFAVFLGNWAVSWWGYPASVAAPLWSVSIEEQFYVVWPMLLRLLGVDRLPKLASSMIVIACATRAYLALRGAVHPAIWTNTFARLDPIALGALLAWYQGGHRLRLRAAFRLALGAAGLGLLVVASRFLSPDGWSASLLFPVVAAAALLCVLAVVDSDATWLRSRPLCYLGRISYGLYVFHLFALKATHSLLGAGPLGTLIGLPVTIALAAVSYRYLEKPFLVLKRRFTVVASRPE